MRTGSPAPVGPRCRCRSRQLFAGDRHRAMGLRVWMPIIYLHGQWALHGWWYYYLYALAIKLPLGTWCLILLAVPCSFSAYYRSAWRDEVVLLLPIVAILTLVSSQSGFSIHSRYIHPDPAICVRLVQLRVARSIELRRKAVAAAVALADLLVGGVVSGIIPTTSPISTNWWAGQWAVTPICWTATSRGAKTFTFLSIGVDNHPEARPLHLAIVRPCLIRNWPALSLCCRPSVQRRPDSGFPVLPWIGWGRCRAGTR